MKKYLSILLCFGVSFFCLSQKKSTSIVKLSTSVVSQVEKLRSEGQLNKPKLVVGIVVDQMRYDYLYRFWEKYSDGGFKKLVNEGFNCKNNHYNYIPTYTGPGHASIFTGATPSSHGIISNYWYDKVKKTTVYCVADTNYNTVGASSNAGKMSPVNMTTTSIADELRLATQMNGKTIGIAIKDRSAILPVGHTANAAYWFEGGKKGTWISSTFYMKELPKWVKDFNNSDAAKKYKKDWNTLYDIETYVESGLDENNFEEVFKGEKKAVFPHKLSRFWNKNNGYEIIKSTPYGNSLTTDFAIAAIDGESLGTDNVTDFLTLSFSSTDYVGHKYGVNSKEVEDTYLRLDKDLERFLEVLDEKLGHGTYTVFLTADHGAVHVPSYLKSVKIPAGYFNDNAFETKLKNFIDETYGDTAIVKNISNGQIFLNHQMLKKFKVSNRVVQESIANEIINYENIASVYTSYAMKNTNYTYGIPHLLQNGYHQKRSGDVLFVLNPSVISYSRTGSTHGSGFSYDTHVPLLFYGYGINGGSTYEKTTVDDIAPTLASLLKINAPNGTTGTPIYQIVED